MISKWFVHCMVARPMGFWSFFPQHKLCPCLLWFTCTFGLLLSQFPSPYGLSFAGCVLLSPGK